MQWTSRARATLRVAAPIAAVALASVGCRGGERSREGSALEVTEPRPGDAGPSSRPGTDSGEPALATLDPELLPPAARRYLPRRGDGASCVYRTFADGEPEGEPDVETRYAFGPGRRPLTIEHTDDAAARATVERRTLDGAGRPVKAVVATQGSADGPGTEEVRFSYEVTGRVVLVRETSTRDDAPFANATAYEFDAQGRVVHVDEDQQGESLETDCRYAGQWPTRIERFSRGRSSVQDFSYDAEGRLLGYVISSAGEVHRRVVTARGDTGFEDHGAPGDPDRSLDIYEGDCAEIFVSPCSAALAPPAPAAAAPAPDPEPAR
jgi:hypothetical protein